MRGRVLLGAAMAAALVAALIYWWRVAPLPPPPEAAYIWYQRGTDAIRDGSYERGRRNLEQAIGLYPSYVLAHARLAEANAELDDQNSAAEDLVRVSALLPNEARLPDIERVRLEGVRRLVLRDVDRSIESFRRLVDLSPDDAGAWLDLGRAQEAAWVRADARHSYEQAIEKDPQYAAAYLRLGYLEALDARKDAALKAYAEAERLYQAASNLEGETEVLLKRGSMHDAFGDLAEARADLSRANALASTSKIVYQQIRARIGLSSVTASEGKLAESEKMASAAVGDAIAAGLNTVAAEGLTDLAATLAQLDRLQEAEADARRAIELAGQRAARYAAARARLQLAAVLQADGRAGDALREVDAVLPFLKEKNYRRFELQGLQIASRAREQLDDLDRARTMSSEVLALAETIKDDGQVALAASNLASVNTALGHYPDALRLRDRAEAIHRRQGDEASLPFDLTNRADLLIRLNRIAEADAALSEVEAGAKKNLEPYKGRARRARFLRAFSAATQLRCGDAVPLASAINPADAPGDSSSVLAVAVMAFCGAPVRAGGQSAAAAPEPDVRPGLARERQYWLAAGSLRRNETARAFVEAQRGLTMLGATANDELRWRLSAVAAAAAQRNGDGTSSTRFFQDGRAALDRVRAAWKSDFATYETRTDLIELRKRAGL